VTCPEDDRLDRAARYLAAGAGGPGPGIDGSLAGWDRVRDLLADEALWACPPVGTVDTIVALALDGEAGEGRGREATVVALAGTELAPGASAEATVRATPTGVAVTLRVDGLAPAPPGSYYQVWVSGPAGSVPIGTFHLRGGAADEPIELWSGVDRAAYPEITVTLEPEDGDPASSRRRVLAGTLP